VANSSKTFFNNLHCFVKVEFINSQSLDLIATSDEYQCLELCQRTFGCKGFTFFAKFDTCQLFSTIETVEEPLCHECISGQKEFKIPEPVCWVKGKCFGKVIHTGANIRYKLCHI